MFLFSGKSICLQQTLTDIFLDQNKTKQKKIVRNLTEKV